MGLTDWVFMNAPDAVIDLYFILSDMFDIEISTAEQSHTALHDSMSLHSPGESQEITHVDEQGLLHTPDHEIHKQYRSYKDDF